MYEDSSPDAWPSSPRTKNWNAIPYRSHDSALATAAVQMLAAGIDGGTIGRPMTLPAHVASGGRNRGASSSRTARPRTVAPTRIGWPRSFALVAMTIAVPVARLTVCLITDDPAAANAESPRRLAMTPIAVSDQIFPGTYLPRFERNQMRDASLNGRLESQATSTLRQPSISTA